MISDDNQRPLAEITTRPGDGEIWSGRRQFWCAALILALVGAAYANSFLGVFVLDDYPSITANPTIREVSWAALRPPSGQGITVESRPILNLSFALNYAVSETRPWSYHAANLVIHALAALVLFGLLRRLLARAAFARPDEGALLIALLWALHPLQTESVTYVVQRTESLMGLFFLLTLYCQVRGIHSTASSRGWWVASISFCALGMGTKEVMVAAPVLALLIDRIFFAESWTELGRKRAWYYGGLFGTWIILGALVVGHFSRGGTVGAEAGIAWWQYAFCQARAIVHYLQLSLWPHPLVFDYGSDFTTFGQIWAYGLLDLALVAATFYALARRSVFGLVGAWFFFILAPTTSVVGGTRQMIAEHRMYLPLLAPVLLAVLALYRYLGVRWSRVVGALLVVGCLIATSDRNQDYRSDLALYADNFRHRPNNPYSTYNFAYALKEQGRTAEAIAHYEAAVRLKPDYAEAHDDLADLLTREPGREQDAIAHFEALLRLKPQFAELHNNFGALLARVGRPVDAISQFEEALRLKPDYPEAHLNLGWLLADAPGRAADALMHCEAAVRSKPDYAEAHNSLGLLLLRLPGRQGDALAQLEAAVRYRPDYFEAHNNLAMLLVRTPGRAEEALEHFETAVRLRPESAEAHFNLGMMLQQIPARRSESLAQLTEAVRLKPDFTAAKNALQQLQPASAR